MKQALSIFLAIVMLSSFLSGCKNIPSVPETTVPETTVPSSELPYLENIPYADQSIFAGPSYDFGFVGTVQVSGIYTITEEILDSEGNLWGKLKSGIGWVDLSDIRSASKKLEPITANFADTTLISSGNYHHCIADTSEYMVQIAFRAAEPLTDISFYSLSWLDGYQKIEDLFYLKELNPDKPLVANVAFPGDFSMYGIRFTDNQGTTHYYCVSTSGRNGSLVFLTYTPG